LLYDRLDDHWRAIWATFFKDLSQCSFARVKHFDFANPTFIVSFFGLK
jgi:hypothetical protein